MSRTLKHFFQTNNTLTNKALTSRGFNMFARICVPVTLVIALCALQKRLSNLFSLFFTINLFILLQGLFPNINLFVLLQCYFHFEFAVRESIFIFFSWCFDLV
jgi:hypothetical protein